MKKRNKNSSNSRGIYQIKMVNVNRKMYERIRTQTIVDNDGTLWLNNIQMKDYIFKLFEKLQQNMMTF